MHATRPALALALALALVAPSAVAATEVYRYVVATGTPTFRTFWHCGLAVIVNEIGVNVPNATVTINGERQTVGGGRLVVHPGGEVKPSHGAACRIPVTAGETLHVRVADDASGDDAPWAFQVFFGDKVDQTNEFYDCGDIKRGLQELTFTVPLPCESMVVAVDAGSLSGRVYVTR